MKNFIKKLCFIIALTFVADAMLYLVLGRFYRSSTTTDEYKLNEVISRINDEVLFMGSSRCHHHYVPLVIAEELGANVYNAGLWGMRNIYFQYGLLCNIVERYTPKAICLEIHPIDYLKTPFSDVEAVTPLAPYINYSEGSDEILKVAGIYYQNQLFRLYRFNSLIPNILVGNISQRTQPEDKGFKRLIGQMEITDATSKPEAFAFEKDETKLHYLQAFINKCKSLNITLIFLYSPMYATDENSNLFDIPNDLAQKNGIPFINHYHLEGITGQASYFYDYGHLNEAGAIRYSTVVAKELKSYLYIE